MRISEIENTPEIPRKSLWGSGNLGGRLPNPELRATRAVSPRLRARLASDRDLGIFGGIPKSDFPISPEDVFRNPRLTHWPEMGRLVRRIVLKLRPPPSAPGTTYGTRDRGARKRAAGNPKGPPICILDGIPKTDPLDSPIIRPEIPALRIGPKSRDM